MLPALSIASTPWGSIPSAQLAAAQNEYRSFPLEACAFPAERTTHSANAAAAKLSIRFEMQSSLTGTIQITTNATLHPDDLDPRHRLLAPGVGRGAARGAADVLAQRFLVAFLVTLDRLRHSVADRGMHRLGDAVDHKRGTGRDAAFGVQHQRDRDDAREAERAGPARK